LDFTMGPQPSTWASSETALPPSLTAHGKPLPLHDLIDGGQGEVSSSPDILQLAALSDNDSSTEAALPAVATTISWHFAQPREVAMLTLTSGASAAAPSGWQLRASSDGQHWHTLDTRQHERFAWPHQTRAFAVHAPGSYAYYRLRIDPAAGAAPTALAEIELLGSDAASP
jgi:hypothetical protein